MARRITALGFLTLLVIIYASGDAFASSSFRCGPNIVRAGDTTAEVLIECGPPTYKEITKIETERDYRETFPFAGPYDEVTQIVEAWYYNCGPHKFIKILTFRGGILRRVDTGDYGSGESDCIGAERRRVREKPRSDAGEVEIPTFSRDLGYGRVSIFGHPHFAEVYLDGKYMGDLPCTLDYVEPGTHDLRVTKAEYDDWEKRITVKAGETLHLEVYLDFMW